MSLGRILGIVGRVCIVAGVATVLFVGFQLWGTGIIEARAQQSLERDFRELLAEAEEFVPRPSSTAVEAGGNAANQPESGEAAEIPSLSAPSEADRSAWLERLYRDEGSAIGIITMPSIGVDKTIVEGVRVPDLRKGPGHYPGTPLPGQAGNVAIAGHRTTYGQPFNRVDELQPGDEIIVETIQGVFTYEVVAQSDGRGHFIVPPTAVHVLGQHFRAYPNRLTLTACHPKRSARQRIIVVAELVGEPAPTFERPDDRVLEGPGELASEFASEQEASSTSEENTPEEIVQESGPAPEDTESQGTEGSEGENSEDEREPDVAGNSETSTGPGTEIPVLINIGAASNGAASGTNAPAGGAAPNSFGEGLNGDSDAILGAVLWGLAATAIWFLGWFAGLRWRRWPSYTLATLAFLPVLFATFWYIDQALPSY